MENTSHQDILNQVVPPSTAELPPPEASNIDEPPISSGLTTREEKSREKEFLLLNEEVEDRKADRALREKFGDKAYKVVRKTLYGWAVLLFCYAYFKLFGYEVFPKEVLIAITTAVTLNVFAAFLGVIRGLFPAAQKKD